MTVEPLPLNDSFKPDDNPIRSDESEDLDGSSATSQPVAGEDLLSTVLQAEDAVGEKSKRFSRLDGFLNATTDRDALQIWFGGECQLVGNNLRLPDGERLSREQVARRLNRDVGRIDSIISDQLNEILHAPKFQKLEASWRGVYYLVEQAELQGDVDVKINALNITWREIERDFERAIEFDQSEIFKKVYEERFGIAGGLPFGVMITDFEIRHAPSAQHKHDDINIARELAKVGAAAFCPMIVNASPAIFGINDFRELEHTVDHSKTFAQKSYLQWRGLRDQEDSRFLGVAMPRVLMRTPYEDDGTRRDRFCFREDVQGNDQSKYLWGGAAFAMGEVLIRSFAQSGWLANIRGVQRDIEGGGLVTGLPVHHFSSDAEGVIPKMSTDVVITDFLERQLADLGFIPLCHCKDTEFSAFYSNSSVQKPKKYDREIATTNARISAMLQYMFCVSRFAHYIKKLGRDKVGSFAEPHEYESFLHKWIMNYVTSDKEDDPTRKARFPLRSASVRVQRRPAAPGAYDCIMHLSPHYELDDLDASVRLVAELTPESKAK